jgi:hypothetical protein
MRPTKPDNRRYTTLAPSSKNTEVSDKELEAQKKAFFAKGGKIEEIPIGTSNYKNMSTPNKVQRQLLGKKEQEQDDE